MKHILSFGAGLNSSTMLILMQERGDPLDLVIFADTGEESSETYEALDYYRKKSLAEFVTVKSPHGNLYDYYYNKGKTPSRMIRDCTDKFKISPMRHYIRERWGREERFTFYIGIDYGESHRMSDSDVKYIDQKYPLVDAKMNREDCQQFLKDRGLLIPPKSGCMLCVFNKKQTWLDMKRDNPELFARAVALEQKNLVYPKSASLLWRIPLIDIDKPKSKFKEFEASCDVFGSCFT